MESHIASMPTAVDEWESLLNIFSNLEYLGQNEAGSLLLCNLGWQYF
jgi:hypothetical protein